MYENKEKIPLNGTQGEERIILSIIIPVYNLERYIKTCLDSILNSNIDNCEIICINDGSSDASELILSSYSDHQNIFLVHQKNSGVSATRNLGISKARGTYIWFIDGDDFLESKNVAPILVKLESIPDILCLSYDCVLEGGSLDRPISSNSFGDGEFTIGEFLSNHYKGHGMPWSFILRTEILIKNKILFDPSIRYYEDEQFMYKMMSFSERVICSSSLVYHYLIRPSSALRTSSRKGRLLDALNVYTDLNEYSKSKPSYYKQFIDRRVSHTICWIIRTSEAEYVGEFYAFAKSKGVFPLLQVGPLKTRMQAKLLNFSFPLFRLFAKINSLREKDA